MLGVMGTKSAEFASDKVLLFGSQTGAISKIRTACLLQVKLL